MTSAITQGITIVSKDTENYEFDIKSLQLHNLENLSARCELVATTDKKEEDIKKSEEEREKLSKLREEKKGKRTA